MERVRITEISGRDAYFDKRKELVGVEGYWGQDGAEFPDAGGYQGGTFMFAEPTSTTGPSTYFHAIKTEPVEPRPSEELAKLRNQLQATVDRLRGYCHDEDCSQELWQCPVTCCNENLDLATSLAWSIAQIAESLLEGLEIENNWTRIEILHEAFDRHWEDYRGIYQTMDLAGILARRIRDLHRKGGHE